MNAKKAKYYRRVARERTIGKPAREYPWSLIPSTRSKGRARHLCKLSPDCTRAEYQRLKAEYKALRKEGLL